MNKIEEVIDLLQQGVDVGDKPEGEIMQQAIDILSEPGSEREPGEFTKELDTFHNNQPTITLENIAFYVEFARKSANEIDRLTAELKAKDEEIERLQQFERFYRHIEAHLRPDDEVICKICGKSLNDIEQALKGGK